MKIQSINPYDQSIYFETTQYTEEQIETCVDLSARVFEAWKKVSLAEKSNYLLKVAEDLKQNASVYGEIITKEVGKPITQSIAEVEKCVWVCEYYAKNGAHFLSEKIVVTDATNSYVKYEPIGCVLAIMPWNYPFWQLFRFLAPTLMVGNVAILKHASNVSKSALALQEIIERNGIPKGVFQTIIADSKQISTLIENKHIKAITLTGSEKAGKAVAAKAGSEIKKTVLELGGSNAAIIFEDAAIEEAAKTGAWARFQNTGQSCIAGKRFIVLEGIYDQFMDQFTKYVASYKIGNPMDESTEIGPMAREDLAEELEKQLKDALNKGAKLILGGKRTKAHFEPTIIEGITSEMRAYSEELFGPVASIIRVKTEKEAIDVANSSAFGLGVSLFSKNPERLTDYISELEDGAVFINDMVKSDPRLPFGGTKISGYGRELSIDGMMEFVNKKTVYIK
jgi:succinate-semialdehyde dehydrogenase / glutarate-semialdehyde dehydrogenase